MKISQQVPDALPTPGRASTGDLPARADDLREHLVATMGHRLRRSILQMLSEGAESAREIGEALELPRGRVSYQLRRLRAEGLIHVSGMEKRRGVVENFYCATVEPMLDNEEFAAFSLDQRRQLSAELAKDLIGDLSNAIRVGSFDARGDRCAANLRLLLDERGWVELKEIHRAALEDVLALRQRAAERLKRSGAAGSVAVSAQLGFQLPGSAAPPPGR